MSRNISKILCAVDLSEHSGEVAEHACMLAGPLGAGVVVMYAVPPLSQYAGFHVPPDTIRNFVGEIAAGAEQSMDAFIEENFKGVEAEGRVVVGYAPDEILKQAREEECGLIVMGTHGRRGIDRLFFGSVAEKIVKNSTVPVLTVRPGRTKAE